MGESAANVDVLGALRSVPLFSNVSGEDLENIAALLIERRYPKHAVVVEEGLSGDYMYVIQQGRVEVTKASDDGREKIIDFLEAGAFFGEMSLLDEAPRSASVRTLEPVTLMAVSRRDFLQLLVQSPELALSLIQELTRRLRATDDSAASVSFQRVEDRAKGLFERIASVQPEFPGRRVTPLLTHQQIADMIGTSRETVTRAVKELKSSGWLEQAGKRYLVP
jgi:CRP/FNR family cyclic AMP-dependent transcriptional regulator